MPSHQQQATDTWRSNGEFQRVSPTGVIGRQRVCRDRSRNLGDPPGPTGKVVLKTQVAIPRGPKEDVEVEVGVGHISDEASNDRGAKG